MNELSSPSPPPRQSAGSPPPKCAICLGTCNNKCFSDSCRHQFCFTCLLEWSKVKAECPLCKQPFKSIIYNIKSNDEYDEHVIVNDPFQGGRGFHNIENYFLPRSPSRHFQFRTTFTVDQGGELAIQQMLLSHPLTNSMYNFPDNYILPRHTSRFGRLRHARRASSATSFRRSVYMTNMWVYAPPDVTGRYREATPQFFSDNPASRNRLVPWLNRELNALLRENTQQVMHLVDVIMDHLPRWHIRSRAFKRLLETYLTNKTDHFIHEFYNFMRSPFDMIGYDRHIVYSNRPTSPTYSISDQEDDSDVAIVNVPEPITVNNNPFRRPTIEVIEINSDSSHDSDVIIGEPPAPEVILLDSDTNEDVRTLDPPTSVSSDLSSSSEAYRKPVLPLKVRFKRKRQSKERRSKIKKKCCQRCCSSNASSSSSSEDSSDSTTSFSNDSANKRSRKKQKYKKKARNHKDSKVRLKRKFNMISSSSDSDSPTVLEKPSTGFDSDDSIPLSQIKHQELVKQKSKKPTIEPSQSYTVSSSKSYETVVDESKPSCSRWKPQATFNTAPCQVSSDSNSSKPITNVNKKEDNSILSTYRQLDDGNRYEPFSNYPLVGSSTTPSVGSRYYEGAHYSSAPRKLESYTPPLPSNEDVGSMYNNLFYDYNYENYPNCNRSDRKFCPQENVPSRVNVAVGTSPLHSGTDFSVHDSYYNPIFSNSRRLQSVIVKKEGKDNSKGSLRLMAVSSESDSN
ncbi:E3 ubiquitin-protein ligase Topors-like isoform X1 [Photinus pyralis]|uniref:E3 ubiquitin-protein ligase Topors n=2 Tax=Photinus pyralis TaxID=7054 RepID=A0A1Y1N1I2_PHOPY|nr:E3 ubiquitin-protein ligase Topors-like isoform X1 [Photinus pyralis]